MKHIVKQALRPLFVFEVGAELVEALLELTVQNFTLWKEIVQKI